MKIAAFPKCYLDDISLHRTMSVFDWIDRAGELGAEGLEMYEGFFWSLDDAYIDSIGEAIEGAGFAMPMLCCSPDFTDPDPGARERAVEREAQMIEITRRLGGPGAVCRVLSGQRRPGVSVEQGLAWVVECIKECIGIAKENDIVLGLENHYKDGYWQYPEFAQRMETFVELLRAIPERTHFGVQYDPSNALVAGDDPVELLRQVADRVVTMHASDRFLEEGTTLDDVLLPDGLIGYPDKLQHGVTGQGSNDYDTIFSILRDRGFDGWVSIEDGINGMEEMRESIEFLKRKRAQYFGQ
ncbi:MAG: sugar phosphate isomerase/epimerase [Caldilineaceae bacterium]|nr:sugar phosphate isomerase/epimerase [Caldilineaceae bacterium]